MSKSPKTDNKIYTWSWEYLDSVYKHTLSKALQSLHTIQMKKLREFKSIPSLVLEKICLRGMNSLIEHIFMVIKTKNLKLQCPNKIKQYILRNWVCLKHTSSGSRGQSINYIPQALLWLKEMQNTILSDFYTNTIFLYLMNSENQGFF